MDRVAFYSDAACSTEILPVSTDCSGSNQNSDEASVGCALARDGVWGLHHHHVTTGVWRPQCPSCDVGEAWMSVEFPSAVQVRCAEAANEGGADGLGVGSGGGHSWDGGVQLEASSDGETWVFVSAAQRSNLVRA